MTLTIAIVHQNEKTVLSLTGGTVPELIERSKRYIKALKLERGKALAEIRTHKLYYHIPKERQHHGTDEKGKSTVQ